MITYKEAKKELNLRIKTLEETIKFLKQNAYYEDFCQHCHHIMNVNIVKMGEPKKFCSNRCRNAHYQVHNKELLKLNRKNYRLKND